MEGWITGAEEPVRDVFWDRYAKYYDCVNRLMPYRKLLWDAYQALELEPGMRVLDAGCGTGNLELFVEEKSPPPITIEAIDFSPGMLATASAKCAHLDWVRFRPGDLEQRLRYEDATFDRVVSINVLYTLSDWRRTVREFMRVTKPGGRVVVTSTKPGLRYLPLAIDHFGRIKNIWGFSRKVGTVIDTLRILPAGVGAGIANFFVLDRREKEGLYRSFEADELRLFFDEQGREDPLDGYAIWPALADQNLMASVTKAAAA